MGVNQGKRPKPASKRRQKALTPGLTWYLFMCQRSPPDGLDAAPAGGV